MADDSQRLFTFVRAHTGSPLALADGHYLRRDGGVNRAVMIFDSSGDQASVTVVDTRDRLGDFEAAQHWVNAVRKDGDEQQELVEAAVNCVNHALMAQRCAELNPYISPVNRNFFSYFEFGFGEGTQLANGEATELYRLDSKVKKNKRSSLDPQQQAAMILNGEKPMLVSEELLIRAKLDLELGNLTAAALQCDIALETLLEELGVDRSAGDELSWLRGQVDRVEAIANSALACNTSADSDLALTEIVEAIERALRRYRYS